MNTYNAPVHVDPKSLSISPGISSTIPLVPMPGGITCICPSPKLAVISSDKNKTFDDWSTEPMKIVRSKDPFGVYTTAWKRSEEGEHEVLYLTDPDPGDEDVVYVNWVDKKYMDAYGVLLDGWPDKFWVIKNSDRVIVTSRHPLKIESWAEGEGK